MNLLMSRQDGREQVSTASASGAGPVGCVVVVLCMQRIDLSRGTETLHLQAARIAEAGVVGVVSGGEARQGCDRCHLQTLIRGKQRGGVRKGRGRLSGHATMQTVSGYARQRGNQLVRVARAAQVVLLETPQSCMHRSH